MRCYVAERYPYRCEVSIGRQRLPKIGVAHLGGSPRAAVFAMARQTRDAWLQWLTRVAVLMAVRLGVDPHVLQTELGDEVRAYLGTLASAEQTIGAPLG